MTVQRFKCDTCGKEWTFAASVEPATPLTPNGSPLLAALMFGMHPRVELYQNNGNAWSCGPVRRVGEKA